jgi:hypothetical protein
MQSPVAEFHFLYVDAGLPSSWWFSAGRRYWQVFRPIVISNLDLVDYVVQYVKDSVPIVAITALSRRDVAPKVMSDIRTRFPAVTFDPVVYDTVAEMALTLDGRAQFNQRFGLPGGTMPTLIPTAPGPTPTFGPVTDSTPTASPTPTN